MVVLPAAVENKFRDLQLHCKKALQVCFSAKIFYILWYLVPCERQKLCWRLYKYTLSKYTYVAKVCTLQLYIYAVFLSPSHT